MKFPLSTNPYASASPALAVAMSLAAHAAGPAIHYIDLHPPGALESSANAISGNQQVGTVYIDFSSDYYRAVQWTGTPESIIYLTPETLPTKTRSVAFATDHGVHGGWINVPNVINPTRNGWTKSPILWNPQAGSQINLHPPNWQHAYVFGMGGGRQVGQVDSDGYSTIVHAMLWSGTAESAIDLHPVGWGRSQALGTNGPQQVGTVSHNVESFFFGWGHAALWQGDAASFVDLNPVGFTSSAAFCTTGEIQGGRVAGPGFWERYYRAGIWRGTAESFVSLHPDGARASVIYGADETWQVGIASIDGASHACAWQGSTDSFLDLHRVLEDDGFTSSAAVGVEVDGRKVKVCGNGQRGTSPEHALLWTIELPDTEPPVIETATCTPDTLWPPNGKLVPVAVEAQVSDNDGVATWHIAEVTCNERFKFGDIIISDDHNVQLRATRAGSNREGRSYTVILIAEDPAGNLSEPFEVNIVVPHDRKIQHHNPPKHHQ